MTPIDGLDFSKWLRTASEVSDGSNDEVPDVTEGRIVVADRVTDPDTDDCTAVTVSGCVEE